MSGGIGLDFSLLQWFPERVIKIVALVCAVCHNPQFIICRIDVAVVQDVIELESTETVTGVPGNASTCA